MNFLLRMVVKEKKDIPIRPVLLKFGVALVFSLGGIVYTYLRTKRIKPPKSKPSQHSPGNGSQSDSRGGSGELRDDDGAFQDSSLRKVSSHESLGDRSSSGRRSGDKDSFLLPEFNELVKECNMSITVYDISPKKNAESLVPEVESPKEHRCTEYDEHEREIKRLQTRVKILEEREKNLEIQLLEYYGIKEHETAVMELKNQLKLNNMEAKLYNLKIESLLSNNKRLEAQVADYTNIVMELEAAKAKIKLLRKKLKSDGEQNREKILTLQEKVMKMEEQEKKAVEIDQDVEMLRREKKELKEELEEMKKSNQSLKMENSDLTQKLDYVQMLATTALDNEEVLELREERRRLRKQNEGLKKEIEQLQADRCRDIEELVYLRWISACLRHELRKYQPGPGKTIARDLSKTLSPKSEEQAKQHILEYANKDGSVEKGTDISDFDSGHWSSSQASCLTDISELDDLSNDTSSANNKTDQPGKTKVFSKLRRLLRGKCKNQSPKSRLERAVSVDDIAGSYSSVFQTDDLTKTSRNSSEGSSSRRSFDIQRSYSRGRKSIAWESSNCSSTHRTSDDGSSSIHRTIESLTEDDQDWSPGIQPQQDAHDDVKNELLKYAEALKKSHAKSFPRRPALYGSR
ncbi:hypothetical protein DH2020_038254 [Rehmannia glutinosa]|uniref:Protein CHUP1, chloroplastic n=1 Tax=Rehmannia glutinosa TaxID=99300 RepID=A0ABR0V0T4_REHGL